jgi:predicted nucleic acid-binding protein
MQAEAPDELQRSEGELLEREATTAEFVLDSSLTMAWCFEDEASPETEEIQDWFTADARAYVPTLWHLEIAIVLWACERRKRITDSDSFRFLAVLEALNIMTDNQTAQHPRVAVREYNRLNPRPSAILGPD